jgi:hypothetical protein
MTKAEPVADLRVALVQLSWQVLRRIPEMGNQNNGFGLRDSVLDCGSPLPLWERCTHHGNP